MRLEKIINHLADNIPIFNRNVFGAANFANGVATVLNGDLPCAAIYPLNSSAGEAQGMGRIKQIVSEHFGVCIMMDAHGDRTGAEAAETVPNMRILIRKAIYNWNPEKSHAARGIYYIADRDLSDAQDRARVMWELEFALDVTITYADGWEEPATPITSFTFTNSGDGGTDLGNGTTIQTVIPPP